MSNQEGEVEEIRESVNEDNNERYTKVDNDVLFNPIEGYDDEEGKKEEETNEKENPEKEKENQIQTQNKEEVSSNRKKEFKKRNEINPEISGEYIPSNIDEDNQLHCKCKKPSYGKMIECEKCYEWFHYICVGIEEGKEPEHYFCEECAESMNDNKNKKREKNNKKK